MSFYQRNGQKSLRLVGYNYGISGAYYATVCTHQRQPLLIEPQLRAIVENEWLALPQRFPAVVLDTFVILPDHIHCLLLIDAGVQRVPTLFDIMKSYKSITTVTWIKHLNATKQDMSGKIWQRYYDDQIIRNDRHLATVRQYILDNPEKATM